MEQTSPSISGWAYLPWSQQSGGDRAFNLLSWTLIGGFMLAITVGPLVLITLGAFNLLPGQ